MVLGVIAEKLDEVFEVNDSVRVEVHSLEEDNLLPCSERLPVEILEALVDVGVVELFLGAVDTLEGFLEEAVDGLLLVFELSEDDPDIIDLVDFSLAECEVLLVHREEGSLLLDGLAEFLDEHVALDLSVEIQAEVSEEAVLLALCEREPEFFGLEKPEKLFA